MPIARKDIIQWEAGSYYHIYNRGARGKSIFREKTNYLYVLDKMRYYSRTLDVSVVSYSLMPTHYHFCLHQNGEQSAGLFPQRVFNSYTKAYNKRYQQSGTLFEGRYKAKPIDTIEYLLHLCRYIHANPVKDGLVADLDDWDYSNYHEWVGKRNGKLFDPDFVKEYFDSPKDYTNFVLDYLLTRDLPEDIRLYLEQLEK